MATLKHVARHFMENAIYMRKNDLVFNLIKNGRSWECDIVERDNGEFYWIEKAALFHRLDIGFLTINIGADALTLKDFYAVSNDVENFLRSAWNEN